MTLDGIERYDADSDSFGPDGNLCYFALVEEAVKPLENIARESMELLAWFCWRVENLTIRSTRTYKRYKNMIKRYEEMTGTKVEVPECLKAEVR